MLRSRVRYLIAAGIVLFWLMMTGILVYREVLAPRLTARRHAAAPVIASDTWMTIYLPGEQPVGFLNMQVSPEIRSSQLGAKTILYAQFCPTLLGQKMELHLLGSAWMPQTGGLADFDFSVRAADHHMRLKGAIREGELDATLHTGGGAVPFRFPVRGELALGTGLGPMLNMPALDPGEEYTMETFDPLTFGVAQTHIRCLGEEELLMEGKPVQTKVVAITVGGMTTKAWATEGGDIVRAETPFGLTLVKTSAEQALRARAGAPATDLLATVAVRPTGRPVARHARRMVVRLEGLPSLAAVPTDDTQVSSGENTYTISMPPAPDSPLTRPQGGEGFAEDLQPDPLVQADHPDIRALAQQIVGAESDLWRSAQLLYEWVYTYIKKEPVPSVPSALDVLATREGDCNEHTVFYAALARAVGIPTRIAVGLVWSDELDGFYYHAWPEVYAGRWIWVDPTLGQPIADATHIKLVSGGIGKWPQIMMYLGQVKAEVLEIE